MWIGGRRMRRVDVILGEGHTLKAVTRWCEDQDAADVRVAVLAVKVHDRCVDGVCADYVGVEVPDRYVFGYGMDFHEQGRNLRSEEGRVGKGGGSTCRSRWSP